MIFLNPITNEKQICDNNIYNKNKISKLELNKLLLYLYNNNKLKKNNIKLSLRVLRKMSYTECCNLLKHSVKIYEESVTNNKYKDTECLNIDLEILKDLAKENYIKRVNNKLFICNELIDKNYKFKDEDFIKTNINLCNVLTLQNFNSTFCYVDNNKKLSEKKKDYYPYNTLIIKYGIHFNNNANNYILYTNIKKCKIDYISFTIILEYNKQIFNIKYKEIFIKDNKVISNVIFDNEYYKFINYYKQINNKTIIHYKDIQNKQYINTWVENNCNNKEKCSKSKLTKINLEDKICVKNKFTDEYIKKQNLIKLNNNMCYDINDIKNLIKFDDNNHILLSNEETNYITKI